MKIPIGPQRVTTWDTLHPPQKQPLPWQRLFVTNNVASSEQKYSLQSGYTAWERTQYVPALPSVAQDMNVTVDICTWFLLQTLIHCPLLLLYFSRMSSSDPLLMSQSAADLFATLIKFFYSAEIWRLKQSAGSLSLSLSCMGRWPTCSFTLRKNPYFQLAVLATGGQSKLHTAAVCRAKTATFSLSECSCPTEFNNKRRAKIIWRAVKCDDTSQTSFTPYVAKI